MIPPFYCPFHPILIAQAEKIASLRLSVLVSESIDHHVSPHVFNCNMPRSRSTVPALFYNFIFAKNFTLLHVKSTFHDWSPATHTLGCLAPVLLEASIIIRKNEGQRIAPHCSHFRLCRHFWLHLHPMH